MTHVAAALIRNEGKILICQRGAGGSTAFLWEFPGGKLEPSETLEECLVRECKEELEIEIKVGKVFAEKEYEYPDRRIAFTFFEAELTGGEIKANVHKDVEWITAAELMDYEFCPADVEIIEKLNY
ncbi:MAG: 8-oxo-dGTP diphosphatase MutT [Oscillospiraceae bacterium]|nr:8-oxo-dGTP diphosphatase MutT [Oscillospiraceae bacterium]